MKKDMINPRYLTQAAIIAALYCALALLLRPFSYGEVQLRVSEALTILPVLTSAAVPGLFIGCLLANILGGCTILDIVFGSLATLIAALITRKLRSRPVLAALPPVLVNAVVVGIVLNLTLEMPLWLTMLWIGLGQLGACYALGLPLLWVLKKTNISFFGDEIK